MAKSKKPTGTPPASLDTVLDEFRGAYVAEHGGVPRADQQKLVEELRVAMLKDLWLGDRRSIDEWTTSAVDAMVMGPDPEDQKAADLTEKLSKRWPCINAVITRWSE